MKPRQIEAPGFVAIGAVHEAAKVFELAECVLETDFPIVVPAADVLGFALVIEPEKLLETILRAHWREREGDIGVIAPRLPG